MTRIKLEQLVWDSWNIEHIKKHNVTQSEVEQALSQLLAYRQGYQKRIILIGRSGKRILALVVTQKDSHSYYVITARDADKKERQMIYEKEKSST